MHSKVIIASLICALAAGFGNAKAQNIFKERIIKAEDTACNVPNNYHRYFVLSTDHGAAGSYVSAELVSDIYYSRLVINNDSSPELNATVIRRVVRFSTPSTMGEYYVTIDGKLSPVLNDRVTIGRIYVYSDGTNAAYSSISATEARAIYYRNYAPQYNREMLFGPEYGGEPYDDPIFDPTPFPGGPIIRPHSMKQMASMINSLGPEFNSLPGNNALISKTNIENDYANFVYGTDDIDTSYQLTHRNGIGLTTSIRVHANWYDEELNAHPLQGVNVGFFRIEQEMTEYNQVTPGYTDANGEYSIDYYWSNNQTIEQIDLKFYSKSEATNVLDGAEQSYPYIYSIPERNFPSGLILDRYIADYEAIDYYVNFYPFLSDRAAAYLIAEAQTIPYNYAKAFNSEVEQVLTYYPANFTSFQPVTGGEDNIKIEKQDYNNFDVLNHEYAHYICDELELCTVEQNRELHNINEDLVNRYGEEEGSKLAYSEGLATYIAIASQMYSNPDSTISGVGDMVYEDSNRNVSVDYNVYKPAGNNIAHYHGVESSITAFLLKALDDASRPYDYITVGDTDMWEIISLAPLYDDGANGMLSSMCDYAVVFDLYDEVDILAMKEGFQLNN